MSESCPCHFYEFYPHVPFPCPFTEEFDHLEKIGGNNIGLNYTVMSVLTVDPGIDK
jgi:hypothetical protein